MVLGVGAGGERAVQVGKLNHFEHGHLIPGSNRNAVNRLDDVDDMPLKVVAEAV